VDFALVNLVGNVPPWESMEMIQMELQSVIRRTRGILLVYSVASRSSFVGMQYYRDKILQTKEVKWHPMVLIGNKCDLTQTREVSRTEGVNLAKSWGIPFFESSAKNRVNIEQLVNLLCYEVLCYEGLSSPLKDSTRCEIM